MSLNFKTTLARVAGLFMMCCTATTALHAGGEVPTPGEADQYRLQARRTLERHSAAQRAHDKAWQSQQADEREQILQPIREKAEQESAEMIRAALKAEARSPAVDTCPFRGVLYPHREPAVPVSFHDWEFSVLNYWGGMLNEVCEGVYAGYSPANPLQGALAVYSHPDEPWRYELYPTPTATGPVRIVAEANGLLVLMSAEGAFDRDTEWVGTVPPDGSTFELVKVPGGATYVFDLRALRYR